jgi:hypothetical protein
MAFEIRLEAVASGPGLPGQVKVTLGRGQQQFVADVPVEHRRRIIALLHKRRMRNMVIGKAKTEAGLSSQCPS